MGAEPLFSVVLITHDRLPLLREAVASVRAQTLESWELIVVDDGSTDGSAEYLRELAAGEDRVVLLEREHSGRLGWLRNQGIAAARGRWIAFLDSDDAWRADKLERHLVLHRDDPATRWSYSGRELMDGAGGPLPDSDYAPWSPHQGRIAPLLLVHEAAVAFPSLVVERALLGELGGVDESLQFCSDYDLVLRLAAAERAGVVAEPLVRVRLHPGSTTRHRLEVDESFIRVYRKFAAAHPEHRGACRRQEAYYQMWVARKRLGRGERLAALAALGRALLRAPGSAEPWRMLLRGVLRLRR